MQIANFTHVQQYLSKPNIGKSWMRGLLKFLGILLLASAEPGLQDINISSHFHNKTAEGELCLWLPELKCLLHFKLVIETHGSLSGIAQGKESLSGVQHCTWFQCNFISHQYRSLQELHPSPERMSYDCWLRVVKSMSLSRSIQTLYFNANILNLLSYLFFFFGKDKIQTATGKQA